MPPLVMGVLNVTPDSFSDGGTWSDPARAVTRGIELEAAGAAVIDVGGESTRPGARPVGSAEETDRVVPVIEGLAARLRPKTRLSVDTRHEPVARAAVAAGASIVNDVSATLGPVAAELGVGWVAMHMRGEPATMQDRPVYGDVVVEVLDFLVGAAERARSAGADEVWIDPGIGFGKRFEDNWALLAHLDRFVATGVPVAVGTSRKGFLGAAHAASDGSVGPTPPDDRLEGSITTAVWAATMGAAMVRVHDVAATVAALRAVGGHRAAPAVGGAR